MHRIGTALLVAAVCASCGSSAAAPRPLHIGNSYLGLDCRDVHPCARLGIALWLTKPELHVTVTLHGRHVMLTTSRKYKYRRNWQGFVHDAVAERLADSAGREVRLIVEATSRGGVVRRAELNSPISQGWG